MKQNTLKWLSCSLIRLIIPSCKKQKGALEDFDSGRFVLFVSGIKMGLRIRLQMRYQDRICNQ
jgi:hypothetical protein